MDLKSWRKSIRKSIGKRLSVGKKEVTKSTKLHNNAVVRYNGISLQALNELWKQLLTGSIVPNTELAFCMEEIGELPAGSTIKVESWNDQKVKITSPFHHGKSWWAHKSQIELKPRQDWSIEDICEHVILPITSQTQSFYLDHVPAEQVGNTFQGTFVSQARKSHYRALLDALNQHFGTQGKQPAEVFLWLDLFCANQPLLHPSSQQKNEEQSKMLIHGLHGAIREFDETLVFFNSWSNPYPLERAWCIWEIYGAAMCRKEIHIIVDPAAEKDVIARLLADSKSLIQAISDLDPRKMQCSDQNDLEMIRAAVNQLPGGFSALKTKITDRLRQWLLVTVEKTVKAQENEEDERAFAELLNSAGVFMDEMGEKEVALSYLERAQEIFHSLQSAEDSTLMAFTLVNIAAVYESQGKFDQALELFESVLEMEPGVVCLATALHKMAQAYEGQGKYELALKTYEMSLEKKAQAFGEQDASSATTFSSMGRVLHEQGKHEEALEMYDKALEIVRKRLGERHPEAAACYNNMGATYAIQHRFDLALEAYQMALEIRKETLGPSSLVTAESLGNIAVMYDLIGEYDKALENNLLALDIFQHVLGEENPKTADVRNNIGLVYLNQGRYEEALSMFQAAMEVKRKTLGELHPYIAGTYANLGNVYAQQGRYELALEMFQHALRICKQVLQSPHPQIALCHFNVGLSFQKLGNQQVASQHLRTSLEIWEQTLGPEHPYISLARDALQQKQDNSSTSSSSEK